MKTDLLCGARFEDLVIIGYIDRTEDFTEFSAVLDVLFIQLGEAWFRLEALDQGTYLGVQLVSDVIAPPQLEDEDLVACRCSIRGTVLEDELGANLIEDAVLWGEVSRSSDELRCSALELRLTDEEVVFFDPTHVSGINIGGAGQRRRWNDEYPGARRLHVRR